MRSSLQKSIETHFLPQQYPLNYSDSEVNVRTHNLNLNVCNLKDQLDTFYLQTVYISRNSIYLYLYNPV